jgi:hypothetical protein
MVWGRGIAGVGCRKYLDALYGCNLGRIEEEVGLKTSCECVSSIEEYSKLLQRIC